VSHLAVINDAVQPISLTVAVRVNYLTVLVVLGITLQKYDHVNASHELKHNNVFGGQSVVCWFEIVTTIYHSSDSHHLQYWSCRCCRYSFKNNCWCPLCCPTIWRVYVSDWVHLTVKCLMFGIYKKSWQGYGMDGRKH